MQNNQKDKGTLARKIMGIERMLVGSSYKQGQTYVDPRKKASERWNPNRKTETIAVRSMATEVE